MQIVLASSSRYRRDLLSRLGLPFIVDAPEVDEGARPDESPPEIALRLAEAKARAASVRHPNSLVIGSDQVVAVGNRLLGKPGTAAAARAQLALSSGRDVDFHTGLCVLNTGNGRAHVCVEPCQVRFRPLSMAQIVRYVDLDQPLDCAGAFRAEGRGILLIERIRGDDPNALIGLPLIRLVEFLALEGVSPLGFGA